MKTLDQMSTAEIGVLITRAAKTLADQASEIRHSPEPGDLRAAMATVLGMLLEIAEMHPDNRVEVATLVARYRPHALDA